jgi:hypothetical protein
MTNLPFWAIFLWTTGGLLGWLSWILHVLFVANRYD